MKYSIFIRGLSPIPLAWTTYNKDNNPLVIKIGASEVLENNDDKVPGTISTDNKKYLHVYCGKDIINVLELQLPGKKCYP